MTWTCKGNVRGFCGHTHRSMESAFRCCQKDMKDCKRLGGYSDCNVVLTSGEQMPEIDREWLSCLWENPQIVMGR